VFLGNIVCVERSKQMANKAKKRLLIFRAWKKHPKTGEKMWAKDYGLKAWPIWVEVAN